MRRYGNVEMLETNSISSFVDLPMVPVAYFWNAVLSVLT